VLGKDTEVIALVQKAPFANEVTPDGMVTEPLHSAVEPVTSVPTMVKVPPPVQLTVFGEALAGAVTKEKEDRSKARTRSSLNERVERGLEVFGL
jgi:hypothetical protein